MLDALVGQFDPLSILAPCLLDVILIHQKVTSFGLGWDNELSEDILEDWRKWVNVMGILLACVFPAIASWRDL